MKLFFPDSAHWYGIDGRAVHSVLSGKREPRPTTLRDARKLALLPSVTNILGVVRKPELEVWLQEQAVLAALTLPRIEGEAEGEFAKRVVEDARSQSRAAMAFGTALHKGAERVARGEAVDQSDAVAPWLEFFRQWFQANCVRLVWTEQVLVNRELGYAGTADLLMEHQAYGLTLVDLKSQHIRGKAGPATYRTWGYQLAAYRAALGQKVTCMNLIMNSKEPHAPVEAPWSEATMEVNWRGFCAARELWVVEKNYDPCASGFGPEGPEGSGVVVPVGGLPGVPGRGAEAEKELCAA